MRYWDIILWILLALVAACAAINLGIFAIKGFRRKKKRNRVPVIIFIVFLSLHTNINLYAINPERTYRYTPDQYGLKYQTLTVETEDGANLLVWHIATNNQGQNTMPVLIVNSDAGNMGYWISLAYYLNYLNYDVWMFDWRGFGGSSDFEAKKEMLFYQEYITDLKAVIDQVHQTNDMPLVIVGYSMGTIVIQEYLKSSPHNDVLAVVFDGYVGNPNLFVSHLAEEGKLIELPKGYAYVDKPIDVPVLIVSAKQDKYCSKDNISSLNDNVKVVEYDCGHIMSLSSFPGEYVSELNAFFQDLR